jgi:L-cystine transport system permease protein
MSLDTGFMLHTLLLCLKTLPVTLNITLVTLAVSAPLAFGMALAKIYRIRAVRHIISLYVSFVRGTPIVLQILIIYSLVPSLLNAAVKSAGLSVNVFDLNPILYAYIVFTLNTTAALSEIFRASLLTVDRGQLEAALATGLSPFQAYRRVVIPQAALAAIPNISTLTTGLIKSTSLAFLMTVKDITAAAKIAASYGYNYIEAYLDIFAVYIIICAVTQKLFGFYETRLGMWRGNTFAR